MKAVLEKVRVLWVSCILPLLACHAFGQAIKTAVPAPEDYHLWSTLRQGKISAKGTWVSYTLAYESGLDTLFVKKTYGSSPIAFAKGQKPDFMGDNYFACLLPDNQFILQNLATGKRQFTASASDYTVLPSGLILLYQNGKDGSMVIELKDKSGLTLQRLYDVTSYGLSANYDKLAFCRTASDESVAGILSLDTSPVVKIIDKSSTKVYSNPRWDESGRALAFVSRPQASEASFSDAVYFFDNTTGKLATYDTTLAADWPKDFGLNAQYSGGLGISDDLKHVFVLLQKKSAVATFEDSAIQVWNSRDKDIYPLGQRIGEYEANSRLACWSPALGTFKVVNDSVHPGFVLTGNQKKALVYSDAAQKPTPKDIPDRDYYLVDVLSGEKELLVTGLGGSSVNISPSPDGRYIAYYKNRHWYLYDIATKRHTCITDKAKGEFYDDYLEMSDSPTFGADGWSSDGAAFLLYDRFDLWEIKLNSYSTTRLTHGREKQQVFRIAKSGHFPDGITAKPVTIDRRVTLLLEVVAADNQFSGYYTLEGIKKPEVLIYENRRIAELQKAARSGSYSYISQDFNSPPALYIKHKGAAPQVVFQSNPQHKQYSWGTSRLISYSNSKGTPLKGVLVYPANYDAGKKYPMVVYIYQKQTFRLHEYVNPTLLNGSGLNTSLFAANGYFVLFPDITYEAGATGFSAVDCVLAATKAAVATASVDKDRIGLTGHSFGGYQTDFIMTQTDIFATAVAGAAMTDLVSGFLSVNPNLVTEDGWRFEYQQFRMGKSLFEAMENYRDNSPITHAVKVKRPILSYTGDADTQVSPLQGLEFYLALRRLGKEHVMVLYPGDDHVILNETNQKDLTKRLTEWFGYYLKGEARPEWLEPK
jgi:dipeptidyl aminopeptidase/acylaminoacyl peptidase